VDREILHVRVAQEPEQQTQNTNDQSGEQDLVTGETEEVSLVQVGEPEVYLSARTMLGRTHPLGHFLGGEDSGCDRRQHGSDKKEESGNTGRDHAGSPERHWRGVRCGEIGIQ